jgi:hypothetical protein
MVPNPRRQPSSQAVLADHTGLPLVDSVLNKTEIAKLLSVPVTWVATHSEVIPGTFRLGRKLRFRRIVVEEWLGGTSPLLNPEEVSEILRVNTSWVYAHADQDSRSDASRLLRPLQAFDPRGIPEWNGDLPVSNGADTPVARLKRRGKKLVVRERYQRPGIIDLGSKWKIVYWDYSSHPRKKRSRVWSKKSAPSRFEAQRLADEFMVRRQ